MSRESKRARQERTGEIIRRLGLAYPDSRCSLDHDGSFQLLVATILSAQCADAQVNRSTPCLFARFPDAASMAAASIEELEEAIGRLNYYRSKARSLKGMATTLEEQYGGEVPADMEVLVQLPGVGRKTANVVLGVAFGIADGVVVDTHVRRVAGRLRLTRAADPVKIERDLLPLVPESERVVFTHRIIDHGRAVCVARHPKCGECVLADICPSAEVEPAQRGASSAGRGPVVAGSGSGKRARSAPNRELN